MKKTTSLLSSLFLSALLSWGVSPVEADELVIKEDATVSAYCQMPFPEMRADTLSWDRPVLDAAAGNIVDFYGPCDHDPTGPDAVKTQRRILLREFYGDSE
jgi:hypothetical protein